MSFWNDSYQRNADSISSYIFNSLGREDGLPNDLDVLTDSELPDAVIVLAWNYFEKVYINRRDLLNKYTQFNQKHLEERAKPNLEELKSHKLVFLSNLLRVVYEYYFWTQNSFRMPSFISTRILERLDKITPASEYGAQFIWIERSLPSALTMDMLTSEKFETMRKMANDVNNYEEKFNEHINKGIAQSEGKILVYEKQINLLIASASESQKSLKEYDEKLAEYKNDYNFVLLSKAFSNLLSTKKEELKNTSFITKAFVTALLLIPVLVLINHIQNWYEVTMNINALAYYIPIFSLELLIFYFMRLYYLEERTIKTQMLQIEQRLSLCEFIHDYVEKKNKDGSDKDSWLLFEKLIFSPIQLSSENIPSLLDGATTVAELAGKILPKDGK
ncbi:hypothetical protein QQF21_19810 [Lelliottia sp. V89_10]|uniref:hypothetical protein n=1 Tax=Lelliottia wanjuensis TaxID=3050585 RepID=UPI00249D9A7E|nr:MULTISPECIES: hypothetical protein [unclassified Lelliottia]MDI3362948.1 hypothetical protein [Lelliottia sp. V89_13]MDK9547838.1 hypothetical protein [Lelliottia sp. V89_5]MDK9597866.1 hypothetical protein [Lelliottia sp. V89_10]